MEIYHILLQLLDKPDVPKFYRELCKYYESKNMENEALAFRSLIESKFDKNEYNS